MNVWVPSQPSPGLPLIVWIHGGAFVFGDATGDFSSYANGTGAVIVSLNYRLGPFGFLNLPGMAPAYPPPSDPTAAVANVGLLDQQLAMAWAKDNAAAFGANASNILLTGQSAGGSSVLYHLTMPGSYGLYSAAVAQSPAAPVNSLELGMSVGSGIAGVIGCTGDFQAQIACLRAASPDAIAGAAFEVIHTNVLPGILGPSVDGALVTAPHVVKMLQGNFNTNVPLVVTETLFEGDALLTDFTGTVVINATEAAAAAVQLGLMVGWNASTSAEVAHLYDLITAQDGWFNGSSRMWGDGLITCASVWAAQSAARYSSYPVRRLVWNTTIPGEPAGRATHGTDLGFYWTSPADYPVTGVEVQRDLYGWLLGLATQRDATAGAAATLPVPWPAYTPASISPSVLVVNEMRDYSAIQEWQEELCESWFAALFPGTPMPA